MVINYEKASNLLLFIFTVVVLVWFLVLIYEWHKPAYIRGYYPALQMHEQYKYVIKIDVANASDVIYLETNSEREYHDALEEVCTTKQK